MDRPTYPQKRYEIATQGFLQRQIPRMPDFDHYSSNDGTANKFYNPTALFQSHPQNTNMAYLRTPRLIATLTIELLQRPEDYQGDKKQYFSVTGTSIPRVFAN
jgi:hypothetical protein